MAKNFGFQPYEGNEPYVYVSYSFRDFEKVAPICQGLAEKGVAIWYDVGLTFGSEWESQIADKIINSSFVILFATKTIFQSDSFIKFEFKLAEQFRKKIIIVFLEDIKTDDIPSKSMLFYVEICRMHIIPFSSNRNKIIEDTYDAIGMECDNSESTTLRRNFNITVNNDQIENSESLGQDHAERKKRIFGFIKKLSTLMCFIFLFLLFSFIAYEDYNFISNLTSIIKEIKTDYLIIGIISVLAFVFITLINSIIKKSLKSAADNAKSEINNDSADLSEKNKSINAKNFKIADKLMKCLVPLSLFELIIYASSFINGTTNQVIYTYIIFITSFFGISSSLKIKSFLISITDSNKFVKLTKIINLFTLILSTIVVFASIAHLVVIGNSTAYTPISYSSWYHEAFVYLYHSFSMCIRNESDIAVPLNFLSQFISMIQMCICYFVILHEVSDMFAVKKIDNYSL